MNKRAPFPPIEWTNAPRLARTPSRGDDHLSGRSLIALRYTGRRQRSGRKVPLQRVIVRNCYYRGDDPCVVENIREYLQGALYSGRQGVSLRRLLASGKFEVVEPPFVLAEPMPDCLVELRPEEFQHWFTTHRFNPPNSMEAFQFKPDDTPLRRLIELHWRKHAVQEHWTPARIRRLCAAWELTPYELAELIQWAPGHMDYFLKETTGFMRLPGPVAVWFYFLENFRLGLSVFPTLPQKAA